jgi:RimJ/RimL family protein N-acetyltransferase
VNLRPLNEHDLAAIEIWYEEAARAAYESRSLAELWRSVREGSNRLLAIERPDEDETIGLLEYAVRDAWLAVPFIALAKGYRGWGYGSEAVRLLEEWAVRQALATRFRAEVDVRNGLGLYFWLRLGYRPGRKDEFGWQEEGEADRMAMVRVVETAGAANAS